jgi:hypothetical protein
MLNAHSVPVSSEAAGYSVVKVRREKKFPSLTPIYRAFREPVFKEKVKRIAKNHYEEQKYTGMR